MQTVQIDKDYSTRDGRTVIISRIIDNSTFPYPVEGYILQGGKQVVEVWSIKGLININGSTDDRDLVECL